MPFSRVFFFFFEDQLVSSAHPNDISGGGFVTFGRLPFTCVLICWRRSVVYMGDCIYTWLVPSIWLCVSYLSPCCFALYFCHQCGATRETCQVELDVCMTGYAVYITHRCIL